MPKLRVAMLLATLAADAVLVACDQRSTTPTNQLVTGTASVAGSPDQHVRFDGLFGDANWGDSSGVVVTFGQLHVSRSDSTDGPRGTMSFLYYSIGQCNRITWMCTSTYGSGFIPGADLTGQGRELHLNTNTTGNADFYTTGPRGQIVADWSVNGVSEYRQTGTWESTYPGIRTHSVGSWSSRSADATGSVVGTAIGASPMASLGTNRNVTMTIYR